MSSLPTVTSAFCSCGNVVLFLHDAVWASTNIKQRLAQCIKIDADSVPEGGPGGPVTIWAEGSDSADTATYTITCYSQRADFKSV